MAITVRIPTVLRAHAGGKSSVEAEGATVGEVLKDLASRYPGMSGQLLGEDGNLHRFVNVYVDDDDVRYLDKLYTTVREGQVVSILPAVAGGGA